MSTIITTQPAPALPVVATPRRRQRQAPLFASLARRITQLTERVAATVTAGQLGSNAETEVSRWTGGRV